MNAAATAATAAPAAAAPTSRSWWALAAVATGQLMIASDATIMNISLPTVQRELGLSTTQGQWVISVFALCYGGFLLLGGRLSQLLGRKRCLLIGLAGYALASVLGGLAVNPEMILTSRALQGVFGALFTPSVLALLGTTFTVPKDRSRAFGIYGTVMGSSSGVGLVLGGVLTDYAGWRWSLLVSVPIAALAATGVLLTVAAHSRQGRVPVDVSGAILATAGLMALVFGFGQAGSTSWAAASTLGGLATGLVLLTLFGWWQSRAPYALLPPRVLLHRRRGGAYLATFSMALGNFAAFFFLTFYLQRVLGYSPVRAGLAFLPYTAAIILGVRAGRRFLTTAPVRQLLVPGLLCTAAGLALLGQLHTESGYVPHLLPVVILLGLGNAWVLVPANSTATQDAGQDTGVAGATVMTSMQIGSSLGIALLGSVAGTAAESFRRSHTAVGSRLTEEATVHGYAVASLSAAGFLCVAALTVFLVTGPRERMP